MSRSYKKTPYVSNLCCRSQKRWKTRYNRTFRRASRHNLFKARLIDYEDYYYEELYKLNYADSWSSPADGFHYYPMFSLDEFLVSGWYFGQYSSYEEYKKYYFLRVLAK